MTRPIRHSGRRALLLTGGAVAALAVNPAWAATVTGASATGTGGTGFEARISAPGEFAALDGPRELVMDVYFGGRRLGEARVVSERGTVRFRDPAAAAALLPQAADPARLAALLSGPLPANADRVCARLNDLACGTLETDGAAVIADEDRLRIDLFVGPALLKAAANAPNGFLPAPLAGPSLASAFGLALSGTGREPPLYNLQARNVFGWGAARVRSNLGVASGFGLLVDDLAVELDRPDQRWTAGLFWAPGNAFTGERRILGASFGTQLDTRADRDGMAGSPQYLFLRQPARVELLVNGRLVDARHYEAGNNILDTTALPSGSYDLVLRVQEGSGPVREERRFFVRSAELAPLGRPLLHAVAGVLAATAEGRPVSLQRQLYFSAGANVRLSEAIGVEAGVSGTQGKLLAQGGLFLMTRFARVHAGALGSTDGDSGALLQVASGDLGPLQFTLDARRVHSRSGQPLLPQTASGTSFGGPGAIRARPLVGSYTQLTGNASLQLGALDLTVAGYYRADGPGRDYSIGPSLSWRMMQLPGMQVTMLADAQKTAGGLAGFVGGRLVMVRGGLSTVSTGGASLKNPAGSASRRRSVGSVTAQWDVQPWEDSRLSLSGGVNREESGTGLTGGASLQSRLGTARADVSRRLGGTTGYSLSLQSGGAVSGAAVALGGRELSESALVATVRGRAGAFELLVDGIPRGRLKGGGSLPLFLAPYRSYSVQLRPLDGGAIDFDPAPRTVTLYPGNVEHAVWDAQRLVTLYGRVTDAAGQPLAGLRVDGAGAEAVSGPDGWFQVDRPAVRVLSFVRADGSRCSIPLPAPAVDKPYLSLGDVTCS